MSDKKLIRSHVLDVMPYIPGKPIAEVKRELGLNHVVKMASNENVFGPSPRVIEAISRAASEINFYPDGACHDLRQALAAKFGAPASNIVVTNGTDEAIRLICVAVAGPEDEVIFAAPSFVTYRLSAMIVDTSIITVATKPDLTHDLDAMLEKITDRTKIIFICNPNNPTGTIVTRAEVERFMAAVPPHVLVVFDEAYNEYVESPEYTNALEEYFKAGRNVAVLRTFSKVYGLAGLRVGFAFVTDELADGLNRVRNPFNVNHLAQEAAIAALADEDHVRRAVTFNNTGRAQLCSAFDEMGLKYAVSQANFILVDVRRDSLEVFDKLLRKGFIIRPGANLGCPTWLRVSICGESDNAAFIAALREILAS